MPSHSVAGALVELYWSTEPAGVPWSWIVWQEITGVKYGLFPSDDARLPRGISRADADDIYQFFQAYSALASKVAKLAFANGSKGAARHPGQRKWASFVTKGWPTWKIHGIIVEELRSHGVHPATLLQNENNLNNPRALWPNSADYIPMILDALGMRLFGEEAFPNNLEILPVATRHCLAVLVQRSWNTIRVQLNRLRGQRDKIQAAAEAAMKELEVEKPTKSSVKQAIRAVARWRDASELFSTPENATAALEALAQLQAVMEGLGVKVDRRLEPEAASKVPALGLKNLASTEDVEDIAALYQDFFELPSADGEDGPPLADARGEVQGLERCDGDFGMEVEAGMKPVQLCLALGFLTGLPPIFAKYRHRTGANAWDDYSLFDNAEEDLKAGILTKFHLHWHQLAGVHSIIRSLFTDQPSTHPCGVLVGDEVGLGKTAQSIALISFFILTATAQSTKRLVPKVIRTCPISLRAPLMPTPFREQIPRRVRKGPISSPSRPLSRYADAPMEERNAKPSLPTLSTTDTVAFWGPSGLFHQAKHAPHNRIIIASHSVHYSFKLTFFTYGRLQALIRDMMATHNFPRKKKKNAMPWDMPPQKSSADLSLTLLGHQYLTVVVDEAHNFRNPGKKHLAILRILENACVRLPMTATPLYTGPRDIAAMLRLVGIPRYFTDVCMAEEKDDAAAIRRAKKLDDDGQAVMAEKQKAVKRLQSHTVGHFLRRSTESLDYKGNILVPLPPYKEVVGVLKIQPWERELMNKCNENARALIESSENGSPSEIKTTVRCMGEKGYVNTDSALV
ncbi:hypothetical protein C0993_007539 [Termitomyces sp. T159_Od127]|nr:hypothetical protein C0993_007539 [Termitomyces sp. T159_Od127]